MKLTKVRVQNYRSVEDSEEFEIGDLTCLVGKNEAGKTALLSAMRGLRPSQPFKFDETIDYEVTQSLFIGANTWLVEGPSDRSPNHREVSHERQANHRVSREESAHNHSHGTRGRREHRNSRGRTVQL